MKSRILLLALAGAAFAGAGAFADPVQFHDFAAFESGNTFFYGDWAAANVFGDNAPIASFSQGAGFYNFTGGSDADSAYAEYFFVAPVDLGANDRLTVSLKLLDGNTAENLTIKLVDGLGETASATFSLSDFTTSFSTASADLTSFGSFNGSDVASFQIGGNIPGGTAIFNVALDELSASSLAAVPEPATSAVLAGVAGLGLALWRRRRTARRQSGR